MEKMEGSAVSDTYHGCSRTLFAGDGCRICESRFASFEQLPAHHHPEGYLCLVLNGNFVENIVGMPELEASAGSVYYLPAGQEHANQFQSHGAHCFRVEIGPDLISQLSGAQQLARPWFAAGGPPAWHAFKMYRHAISQHCQSLIVEELLIETLFELAAASPKATRRHTPSWVRSIRARLMDALDETPTLNSLASYAGVHAVHLTRSFRQYYGCSIGEFLQTHRVAKAGRLLIQTKEPLAMIAAAVGYYDQSHFTKMFRARTGYTPAAFRERNRAN